MRGMQRLRKIKQEEEAAKELLEEVQDRKEIEDCLHLFMRYRKKKVKYLAKIWQLSRSGATKAENLGE